MLKNRIESSNSKSLPLFTKLGMYPQNCLILVQLIEKKRTKMTTIYVIKYNIQFDIILRCICKSLNFPSECEHICWSTIFFSNLSTMKLSNFFLHRKQIIILYIWKHIFTTFCGMSCVATVKS